MTTLAYLQWVERKVIAHIQARIGPSRVGPHGLLQPLADVIKLITKEDLLPPYVNKFFLPARAVSGCYDGAAFDLGDSVWIGSDMFGHTTWMQLADLNVGVLFVLAVSSLGVYGIALAGWASNNKYSLLGGLRSSAQLISYELPLSLAVAAPLLLGNTLELAGNRPVAGWLLLWFSAQVEYLPGAVAADLQLLHFPDCRLRGDQSRSVRSAGGGNGAGRRISTPNTAA